MDIGGTPLKSGEAVHIHESFINSSDLEKFKRIDKGNTVIITSKKQEKNTKDDNDTGEQKAPQNFDINNLWVYPKTLMTKEGVLTKNKLFKAQIVMAQDVAEEQGKKIVDEKTFDANTTEANIEDFYMPLEFIEKG